MTHALRASVLGIVVMVAGALAGCSTGVSELSGGDANVLSIVATTTHMADFMHEIAGNAAHVTQLIQPNHSAHDYEPSPADLRAVAQADLVISNGRGLENWLPDLVSAAGYGGAIVDASIGIDATGHLAHDPHVWMNVNNARIQVRNIETALCVADPQHAAFYESRADAYDRKLASLDDWIRSNIDAVPASQRLFIGNHDAFGHFTDTYGVTSVGSVIANFDDNAEPSVTDINRLISAIRATGARAIFVEASLSSETANTIAQETGISVYSGEGALYVDSLGPADSPGATYIAAQVHNVRRILQSWGLDATPLPSEISAGDQSSPVTEPVNQ